MQAILLLNITHYHLPSFWRHKRCWPIIAAIRRELSGIEGILSSKRRIALQPAYLVEGEYAGRAVVLAATGIGKGRTQEAVSSIVDTYHPEALVCLGYAGAASEELSAGDLVLCPSVYLLDGDARTGDSRSSDAELMKIAHQALQGAEISYHEGDGVTVPHLVVEPEAKRSIGRRFGVKVIDMESYWVAETAAGRGVPFLGLRAVTDPVTQRVPNLISSIDGTGGVTYAGVLAHALTHPRDIYPIVGLSRYSIRASRNLARFCI